MKVLLVYPNARSELIGWGDLGAIAEPLALEYLAAGALSDGHEVRILDLRFHRQELNATLQSFRPDVVGVTGYSMHVLRNLEICKVAKELVPDCRTIAGGHHATLLPEDFFEPQIDFVVQGEGVQPFTALLRMLEAGQQPHFISGLWARAGGKFMNGGTPAPFDIDSIPPPDRTLTARDRGSYFIDWMKPIALARSTVGCPYRCSFCSLWKIMDGKYHMRGVDRVVAELANIAEECVFLVDDEAFIHRRRMTELANAIREAGLRKRYFTYCRIDTLLRDRDLMELWREIGLERLFIGIEAVSSKDLAEYNKRLQISQIEDGLAAAHELGIAVFAGFIVNTSFTARDFAQLVRFIEHNHVSYPSFTILTPLPGTPALANFDSVIERQANGRPNWELFDLQNPVTRTTLPRDEFMREYYNLFHVFSGKSLPFREDIMLRNPREARTQATAIY
jgi:radical SAM superfamily enzyme YgiQ (UPF0313 family)